MKWRCVGSTSSILVQGTDVSLLLLRVTLSGLLAMPFFVDQPLSVSRTKAELLFVSYVHEVAVRRIYVYEIQRSKKELLFIVNNQLFLT
jgi:hypothetical protein